MSTYSVIAIAAGGTGGHVFPALALAHELTQKGIPCLLCSDERGVVYGIKRNSSIICSLPHGRNMTKRFTMAFILPLRLLQVMRAFYQKCVRGVVSFGGYASLPYVMAAKLMGLPLIIHEQNALFGRLNRYSLPFARKIALTFARTLPASQCEKYQDKISVTGLPIRPMNNKMKSKKRATKKALTIGVIGGSQGAHALSQIVPHALEKMTHKHDLSLLHQARIEDVAELKNHYQQLGITADVRPFFEDMASFYNAIDLLIARAGASTLAEASFYQLPLVLVPYPHAADGHQHENAKRMVALGAALMIEEGAQATVHLQKFLEDVRKNPSILQKMSVTATLGEGRQKLCALIQEVMA